MSEDFTTKENNAFPLRKPVPLRPRKSHLTFLSPSGARAVSFSTNDNSLSQCYDRNSSISYLEQCFEVLSCIGHGCFGVVFKVNSLEDGKLYAIKKSRERFRNTMDKKRKLIEVERLERIPKHPNCIQMYRAWEENGYLFLQLELCELSLAEYTLSHHKIPEKMIWNILTDIALALRHLHDLDIMHLDIKLDNILMANDGSFKLSDFGISLDCSQICKDFMDGDPRYLAPEVLNENFSKSADVFSLGISIYELSYDVNLPQSGMLWQNLRKGQIPCLRIDRISKDLFGLITWMMHPKPDKRPTAGMILMEPHIERILMKRKISNILETLATPGKLIISFIAFFGKAGYDMVMKALFKFWPLKQNCSSHHHNGLRIPDEHSQDVKTNDHAVVTSTPITGNSEQSRDSPERFEESWEVSKCYDSSMDTCRLSADDSPSEEFFRRLPSSAGCRRCNNTRVHPYSNLIKKKLQPCVTRKGSTIRNLSIDFSDCVKD
ncbi:probable protein kinase DDB_G0291842 [Hetaerina americana]|uniref:probable protein kinase DDB_G0291842 n=1 Tax=Hetaerina americana TaxID=62018 RepID=UPI003A7F29AE